MSEPSDRDQFCEACWLKRYDAVLELQAVCCIATVLYSMYGFEREFEAAEFSLARLFDVLTGTNSHVAES